MRVSLSLTLFAIQRTNLRALSLTLFAIQRTNLRALSFMQQPFLLSWELKRASASESESESVYKRRFKNLQFSVLPWFGRWAMVFFSPCNQRAMCTQTCVQFAEVWFSLAKEGMIFTSLIIPQKHWFFFQTIFFFIFSFKKLGNFWRHFFKSENSTKFCYFFFFLFFPFLGVKNLPYFRYHKVEKKLCPNFKSNLKNLEKKKEKEKEIAEKQ